MPRADPVVFAILLPDFDLFGYRLRPLFTVCNAQLLYFPVRGNNIVTKYNQSLPYINIKQVQFFVDT